MKSKTVVQQIDAETAAARDGLHKAKLVVQQLFKNDLDSKTKAIVSAVVYVGMTLIKIADSDSAMRHKQSTEDDHDEQSGA